MRQRMVGALLVAGAIAIGSSQAASQGWTTLPNGNTAYLTNYTTSGMFQCGNARYLIGSCFATGNSVTLVHNGSGAIISFTPVTKSVAATIRPKTVALGTLTISYFGSGPRAFPKTSDAAAPIFYFRLGITVPGMIGFANPFYYTYKSRPTGLMTYAYNPELDLNIPPSPQGFGKLRFFYPTDPSLTTADESIAMTAQVAVAPEPVTIALLGSGLVGIAGIARRRSRREK